MKVDSKNKNVKTFQVQVVEMNDGMVVLKAVPNLKTGKSKRITPLSGQRRKESTPVKGKRKERTPQSGQRPKITISQQEIDELYHALKTGEIVASRPRNSAVIKTGNLNKKRRSKSGISVVSTPERQRRLKPEKHDQRRKNSDKGISYEWFKEPKHPISPRQAKQRGRGKQGWANRQYADHTKQFYEESDASITSSGCAASEGSYRFVRQGKNCCAQKQGKNYSKQYQNYYPQSQHRLSPNNQRCGMKPSPEMQHTWDRLPQKSALKCVEPSSPQKDRRCNVSRKKCLSNSSSTFAGKPEKKVTFADTCSYRTIDDSSTYSMQFGDEGQISPLGSDRSDSPNNECISGSPMRRKKVKVSFVDKTGDGSHSSHSSEDCMKGEGDKRIRRADIYGGDQARLKRQESGLYGSQSCHQFNSNDDDITKDYKTPNGEDNPYDMDENNSFETSPQNGATSGQFNKYSKSNSNIDLIRYNKTEYVPSSETKKRSHSDGSSSNDFENTMEDTKPEWKTKPRYNKTQSNVGKRSSTVGKNSQVSWTPGDLKANEREVEPEERKPYRTRTYDRILLEPERQRKVHQTRSTKLKYDEDVPNREKNDSPPGEMDNFSTTSSKDNTICDDLGDTGSDWKATKARFGKNTKLFSGDSSTNLHKFDRTLKLLGSSSNFNNSSTLSSKFVLTNNPAEHKKLLGTFTSEYNSYGLRPKDTLAQVKREYSVPQYDKYKNSSCIQRYNKLLETRARAKKAESSDKYSAGTPFMHTSEVKISERREDEDEETPGSNGKGDLKDEETPGSNGKGDLKDEETPGSNGKGDLKDEETPGSNGKGDLKDEETPGSNGIIEQGASILSNIFYYFSPDSGEDEDKDDKDKPEKIVLVSSTEAAAKEDASLSAGASELPPPASEDYESTGTGSDATSDGGEEEEEEDEDGGEVEDTAPGVTGSGGSSASTGR
ncbi:hypothetical protein WDU94_000264 [Cyamophila willieti]